MNDKFQPSVNSVKISNLASDRLLHETAPAPVDLSLANGLVLVGFLEQTVAIPDRVDHQFELVVVGARHGDNLTNEM